MGNRVNAEVVNDTAKLVMHRLVSRMLARDPSLVDRAKATWAIMAERYPDRTFVGEWEAILNLPIHQIRAKLVSRDEDMVRLRLSSPFLSVAGSVDFKDADVRRRIWKLSRRLATLGHRRDEECQESPGPVA